MISVSDIIKALQEIPVWKKVAALPDRVDSLERRLAALEASRQATPSAGACRFCHGPLRVTDEKPDPIFGDLGRKELTLECQNPSCGRVTTRSVDD